MTLTNEILPIHEQLEQLLVTTENVKLNEPFKRFRVSYHCNTVKRNRIATEEWSSSGIGSSREGAMVGNE